MLRGIRKQVRRDLPATLQFVKKLVDLVLKTAHADGECCPEKTVVWQEKEKKGHKQKVQRIDHYRPSEVDLRINREWRNHENKYQGSEPVQSAFQEIKKEKEWGEKIGPNVKNKEIPFNGLYAENKEGLVKKPFFA